MKLWFPDMFFINSANGRFYLLVFSSMCFGLSLAVGISEYGAPCDTYENPCSYNFECIDSKCQCHKILTNLRYISDGSPSCDYNFKSTAFLSRNGSCSPECTIKQECLRGSCQCIKGYVMSLSDNLCRQVVNVKPMDMCEVREKAMLCDSNLFSTCKNSICICFKKYYYNFTTEQCLLKPSGYKALYNEYCREDEDCLDGIQCSRTDSYRCQCPSSCSYKEEFGACDCGEISVETPVLVIVIGCIIGICSVIFWIYVINRTWNKASYESNSCDVGEDNPLDSIPPGNTFPIDQPVNQYDKPNSFVDDPPTYKEAVFSSPTAPIGFNTNNAYSVDGNITTKNCASPYIPYFPPPQSNYQDSQNYSSSSVGKLPHPISTVTPTAPTLTSLNATGLPQAPYPVSPQIPSDDFTNSTASTPYPLAPSQDLSGKAP